MRTGPSTVTTPGRELPAAPAASGSPRWPGGDVVLAGLAYLALAVALWWGVWSTHPTATATCGCGDAARFTWFAAWPAFALTHGHSLLWSSWLFHPGGINLLDDTSVLGLGLPLAPLTWLAGPVATLNVGLTLAPALSALSFYVLVRRWVTWRPAAFVGGLLYGFSAFMVAELALSQLNIAFLAVPPLIALVLSDVVGAQRRSSWTSGILVAGLLAVQFFLSTEILLITVATAMVGLILVGSWAAIVRPAEFRSRLGHVVRTGAIAVAGSTVLLAYPLWFLLAGPAHLVGPIWSLGATARFGTTPASFVSPSGLENLRPSMLRFGGYQGPVLAGLGYLGAGVVIVAVGGLIAGRRDRRLWFFASLGVVMAACSLAPGRGVWVPWAALGHLPWVGQIVEVRLVFVVNLCLAAMVALTVDHARTWVVRRSVQPSNPRWRAALAAGAVAWGVALVAVVPNIVVLSPNLPLTVRPVALPRWFADVGPSLPAGQVVLTYPVPFSGLQASQAWQAVNAMRWAQAGGGGPQGQPFRAGGARAGFTVLSALSLPLAPTPQPTADALKAVRAAMDDWQVTTVVVPVQEALPVAERGRPTTVAVAFLTAALGEAPHYNHQAYVWDSVTSAPPPLVVSAQRFDFCTRHSLPALASASCLAEGS